ncbi:PREDICTED: uncharacterized protein LOC109146686 isoform X2 [Ipomoea nil]|uniref:uncharacterized protein LOC109146686 isoform X2 n=1 Tax=Ipomoea nil TaxID=35883 RepID=UPI0009009AD3|nr:PREDICTED: uncharacterized protein LOC109146686 isoform X2 [Ipomoea nil]
MQQILAPYHQNPPSKTVYVFDPLKSVDRNLAVKVFVNMAFRSVPGRGIRTVDWKKCRCPQQPGGSECGYYILRYMFEIVSKHSELHCLEEIFEQPTYSIDEIDDIRELWAQYFVDQCL